MKKIIILCGITIASMMAYATTDFQRRFGSDSVLYNEPLYFASTQQHTTRDKRPRKSFREQLRQNMHKNEIRKKRVHRKSVTHSLDLFDQYK